MNLDEETQKALMSKRDENNKLSEQIFENCMNSFCEESKPFKEWYKNRKDSLKINSSAMSMLSEVKIAETVYTKGGRTLVWSEEFENVTSLSQTKMAYHCTMNNPSLKITNDDSNLSFKDGIMTMYARPAGDGFHYSIPDGITTYGTMAYIGGYLEMRAKVPFEHGAWSSFWMKSNTPFKTADYMAEIDIFEVFSSDRHVVSNLHKWESEGRHVMLPSGEGSLKRAFTFEKFENLNNEYHIYGFEWDEHFMSFYIDDEMYTRFPIDGSGEFGEEIKAKKEELEK